MICEIDTGKGRKESSKVAKESLETSCAPYIRAHLRAINHSMNIWYYLISYHTPFRVGYESNACVESRD